MDGAIEGVIDAIAASTGELGFKFLTDTIRDRDGGRRDGVPRRRRCHLAR